MTYEQYWYWKPGILINYSNVYEDNAKEKNNWIDVLSHRVGIYVRECLQTIPIISIPLIDKVSETKLKNMFKGYPKLPYALQNEIDKTKVKKEIIPPTKEDIARYNKIISEYRQKKGG